MLQVGNLEEQQSKLHAERQAEINHHARQLGLSMPPTRDQLLKEIMNTMSLKKKLHSQVTQLESDINTLEKQASSPTQNVSCACSHCRP